MQQPGGGLAVCLGQTQERISQKPQCPQCVSHNSKVRIKRLKCFVFSWTQPRKGSASLSPLCVKNCLSLILLHCCASILLPFCLCSPLNTSTQSRRLLVNRPVCSGADLRVVKQSHRCFSVTLVGVTCLTHHNRQVQPAPTSCHPSLGAHPMALQALQCLFSPFHTS